MSSLYQRLRIETSASQAEIRRAYHQLAMRYHPDRNLGDKQAEEEFKNVVTAFEILGDPKARALYDQGRVDDQGRPQPRRQSASRQDWVWNEERPVWEDGSLRWSSPPPPGGAGAETKTGDEGSETAESKDEQAGSVAGDAKPDEEKQYRLSIDFVAACLGTSKHVRLPNKAEFKINIPAGVNAGQKLRVKGAGENGKPFLVKIDVEEHRLFKRDGDDILLEVPITPYECYYGIELDIPTIHGPGKVSVMPEAQDGETIPMPNMGVRRGGGVGGGDQLVTLRIVMPTSWAAETRFAMADWRRRAPYNPRRDINSLLTETH